MPGQRIQEPTEAVLYRRPWVSLLDQPMSDVQSIIDEVGEEYIDRQATILWGHTGFDFETCRTAILVNLLRGVQATEDLAELAAARTEEERKRFGL